MTELLIKGSKVVDGSGASPFLANVGIDSGKIVFIGEYEIPAQQVIDGSGLILAPGFIDSHSHDDIVYFWDPSNINKLSMGVTTTISGNCGESFFPVAGPHKDLILNYFSMFVGSQIQDRFTTSGLYFQLLEDTRPVINVGAYVGHGTLRMGVMGFENRAPTEKEYQNLEAILAEAMSSGAFGLSTGLLYAPGSFSKTDELIRLGRTVARYGGVYVSHLRHEGEYLVSAVQEAIEIGRRAEIGVILSHLKVMGKANQGISARVIELIEAANQEGLKVTGDVYPYEYGATYIPALFPPDLVDGGFDQSKRRVEGMLRAGRIKELENKLFQSAPDWVSILSMTGYQGILIISAPSTPEAEGKSLSEYAADRNIPTIEALAELFIMNDTRCMIAMYTNTEYDMGQFIQCPYVAFCSDGITLDRKTVVHPRTTGSFTKVLREIVREKKTLSLSETIRKMTSLACQSVGIRNKGMIRAGFDADVVLFDLERVTDRSDIHHPGQLSEGIEYVIVNGKIALARQKLTGESNGLVLRKS